MDGVLKQQLSKYWWMPHLRMNDIYSLCSAGEEDHGRLCK